MHKKKGSEFEKQVLFLDPFGDALNWDPNHVAWALHCGRHVWGSSEGV